MAFCTSGSAAKTLALNPGGSFISASASAGVIGGAPVPPGTVLVLMIWGNWAAPSAAAATNDKQKGHSHEGIPRANSNHRQTRSR